MVARKKKTVAFAKFARFIAAVVVFALAVFASSGCYAQRYPGKPIQLIIPAAAGASLDIGARILAAELEGILNTRIVPVNRAGASGIVATDAAIRGKNDGYTLFYGSASALVYAPNASPDLVHYEAARDLEPLGSHYFNIQAITVRSDAPWRSFRELIDHARKNPGKLIAVTAGVGSPIHFNWEILQAMTGAHFAIVPFEGGAVLTTSILGGHADVLFAALGLVRPHVESGRMKMLLLTRKMPAYPATPTLAELGYNESLPAAWFGVYSPVGIPAEVRKILVPAIAKAVDNTKARIEQMGGVVDYKTPSGQREMFDIDYRRIYEIAVKTGMRKP